MSSEYPLIISYATPGPYEQELARLRASCEKFGLRLDYEIIESKGSWVRNCAAKPGFIRRKRSEHPGQPLIWMDADAEVVAEPLLLKTNVTAQVDMSVFRGDVWGRRHVETISCVVATGTAPVVDELVDLWVQKCENDPEEWDQRHLAAAIAEIAERLIIQDLPAPYCYIERAYKDKGIVPVIMQYQASRRLKRAARKA